MRSRGVQSGSVQGREVQSSYAEDRCALTWPLLTAGLYGPVLAIALFVVALAVRVPVFYWTALALLGLAVTAWVTGGGSFLQYFWPLGIRLDQDGVRIGGVRWAERHPGQVRTGTAIVPKQYSQVFSVPWDGVLSIGLTSERDLLKIMRRRAYRGRKLTPLGNLATPFMRAALVIWADEAKAQMPKIRPATGALWFSFPEPGYHQPVWVVPTRHPARLATALSVLPLPSGLVRDPREPLRARLPRLRHSGLGKRLTAITL